VETIRLSTAMPRAEVNALEGKDLYIAHYDRDRVIRGTATVLKPNGKPLLIYVKDALTPDICRDAFNAIKDLRFSKTDSRGSAAGGGSYRRTRKDGTLSRTVRRRGMYSEVMGFLDPQPRKPHCRMTAFTRNNLPAFGALQPLIVAVNDIFQKLAPDRWQAQHEYVRCAPDFVIPGTVFTSVTINRSERTAGHRDSNDYRRGFGVMVVLEGGHYNGAELIFPRYRIAVDMRERGVCLADVHELHGNAPQIDHKDSVRFAFVFYSRDRMHECGTVEEEKQR
jgi:hypothetical protein